MVSVRLEPMSQDQYDAYRVTAEDDYAASFRDSGALPDAEARTRAAEDFARLLPDGFDTEGHRFWTAYDEASDGGEPVGMLWLHAASHLGGAHGVRLRLLGARGPAAVRLRSGDHARGRATSAAGSAWCRWA